MKPLRVTAELPHGVCFGAPWGISLDGLLASVLWHRRKATAAARGEVLTYDPLDWRRARRRKENDVHVT